MTIKLKDIRNVIDNNKAIDINNTELFYDITEVYEEYNNCQVLGISCKNDYIIINLNMEE